MKKKNIITAFEKQADFLMDILSDLEKDINTYFIGKKVRLYEDDDGFGIGTVHSVVLCDNTLYFNVDFSGGDMLDDLEKDELIFLEDENE